MKLAHACADIFWVQWARIRPEKKVQRAQKNGGREIQIQLLKPAHCCLLMQLKILLFDVWGVAWFSVLLDTL